MARAIMRYACGGGGCFPATTSTTTSLCALASLPREVWDKIVECLVGWDLLALACVSRVFRTELLVDASLWAAHLPQSLQFASTERSCKAAKSAYASHKSFRFRGQRIGVDSVSLNSGDRGACIETLRFLPTASQRDVQLFVPLAPRRFSIDLWFSLQHPDGTTFSGGILLGAQSARWQDAMVWPDYHQQFIHVGPHGDLYCSVTGDKRVVGEPLETRRWYHLALVFEGDRECVYLNGSLQRRTNGALHRDWRSLYFMQIGTGCISAGSVGVPSAKFSGWYAFNGMVEELRLWEEPLTPKQVETLAQDREIALKPTGSLSACEQSTHLGGVEKVRCSRPRERMCVEWKR